jgi:hypothetical protein
MALETGTPRATTGKIEGGPTKQTASTNLTDHGFGQERRGDRHV